MGYHQRHIDLLKVQRDRQIFLAKFGQILADALLALRRAIAQGRQRLDPGEQAKNAYAGDALLAIDDVQAPVWRLVQNQTAQLIVVPRRLALMAVEILCQLCYLAAAPAIRSLVFGQGQAPLNGLPLSVMHPLAREKLQQRNAGDCRLKWWMHRH